MGTLNSGFFTEGLGCINRAVQPATPKTQATADNLNWPLKGWLFTLGNLPVPRPTDGKSWSELVLHPKHSNTLTSLIQSGTGRWR